ncbi:Uncharacterised protein [Mycobacteroides abscessus subsp. abscessus]|nr:Uncharacterised protein [Mycobacteroides abscessus subsp. abscessus]SKV60169.1 Uncharacterised protein [Mycobacteroides abscessus subsp. abscessus]
MYVAPTSRMSARNRDAENFAGANAAPAATATAHPASTAFEWNSGIDT